MLSLPKTGSCGMKPPQSHLTHLQCASSLGPAGKISKRIASSLPPGILLDLCHLLSQRAASAALGTDATTRPHAPSVSLFSWTNRRGAAPFQCSRRDLSALLN